MVRPCLHQILAYPLGLNLAHQVHLASFAEVAREQECQPPLSQFISPRKQRAQKTRIQP